jgi:hypothetical protein
MAYFDGCIAIRLLQGAWQPDVEQCSNGLIVYDYIASTKSGAARKQGTPVQPQSQNLSQSPGLQPGSPGKNKRGYVVQKMMGVMKMPPKTESFYSQYV